MVLKLLLYMYTHQKLTVQWNNSHSDVFVITNGVKQGGNMSPLLFCVYIDNLLLKLTCKTTCTIIQNGNVLDNKKRDNLICFVLQSTFALNL